MSGNLPVILSPFPKPLGGDSIDRSTDKTTKGALKVDREVTPKDRHPVIAAQRITRGTRSVRK